MSALIRKLRVLSKYSADGHFDSMSASRFKLRSSSMVEPKHPPEALEACDGSRCGFDAACLFEPGFPLQYTDMCLHPRRTRDLINRARTAAGKALTATYA